MTATLKTISPIDGSVFVERPLASDDEVAKALIRARSAQRDWSALGVEARAAQVSRFVDAFVALKSDIAREITWQMGRPIRYTPNEVGGFEERARHMIAAAPQALADLDVGPKPGFRRFIRRVPLGVVLVVATLELSAAHCRQRDRAGADGRKRRHPQAFASDSALRRAHGGSRRSRRSPLRS